MREVRDFLFLNRYSFVLAAAGALALLVPLWSASPLFLFAQIPAALFLASQSQRLFSTYPEKKRMLTILFERNRGGFRPASFAPYMKAPCSRLVVRLALRNLGMSDRYRELLAFRPSLAALCRESLKPTRTRITYGDSSK